VANFDAHAATSALDAANPGTYPPPALGRLLFATKEDLFVATLRCLPLNVSRSLYPIAAAIALAGVVRADETNRSEPPRAIMRLPRWIESIGEPTTKRKAEPQTMAAPTLKAHGSSSNQGTSINQGGTTRSAVPQATGPVATVKTPMAAAPTQPVAERTMPPVMDAATPTYRAETRPAQAVLRAEAQPMAQPAGRQTAEWTELVPTGAPAASPATTTATEESTGKAGLGPETSVLKRWLTDKVSGLPKPTVKPPASLAGAVTTKTDTTTSDAATADPSSVPAELPVADRPIKATVTAPVAATPDEMPTLSIDPASFRGVHPGKTTGDELRAGWGAGEPFTREDGTRGFFWKIEPFERVEVTLDGDVVAAIRIKLAEPVAVGDLAKQLEISDLRTVSILDEQGVSIGEVFPERGVIFSVRPGTQSATAVMIEPLDPESFVLRAEGEIDTCSAFAVADLQYAIEIDPSHLRAHRLLMVLMCEQGKWQQALRLAEAAEQIDPSDVWTKMKHGGILLSLDRPEEARAVVEAVKATPNTPPLVTAQVERLLGRIELADATPDHQKAVEHFAESIRRSSALLAKRSPAVQQAAREIMLDAHLGTAQAIAQGTWQQKSRVIPKWMARSEAVVAECKAEDSVQQTLELQLCRGALAVAAGSTDSFEPLPWVKRLLEVRDRMGESVKDPWRRRQIDWEVGLGLLDALAAAQLRGDASDMLDNATLTAAYLERGGEHRQLTDKERKNAGDLLFRIGIMHSLQRGDHATAVTWFDRVIPMWEGNPRLERDREAGHLGESYVSMAISYWQVDRRDDAMALSRRGVDLMVAAVDSKQLEERSLAVAYGNLSTMYAEQGDETQSQTYAEMASRAEASSSTVR
jgi:tetratricopeptide (TPR) repeat protein